MLSVLDRLFGGMTVENYEERKIGRFESKGLFISTVMVTDGTKPYETAIECKNYSPYEMIIVESYSSKKKALAGHNKWVKKMTGKNPPKKLTDCQNSMISKLCDKTTVVLKK